MIMKRIACITLGLISYALTFSQDKIDTFGDDKRAFILLPAESISSGFASDAQFSPSGRYITYVKYEIPEYESAIAKSLVEPREPMKRPKWYRYDRVSKTSKLIPLPEQAEQTVILGDERTVYFYSDAKPEVQGFIDVPTGNITKTSFDLQNCVYYGNETVAPYFMFKRGERDMLLVKPNGQSLTFTMPPKVRIFKPFRSDASSITFLAMMKSDPTKVGNLIYKTSDGSTSFKELSRAEFQKDAGADATPMFKSEKAGDLVYVKLWTLPKDLMTDLPTRAKLCLSSSQPRFGPTNDCVVYEDAGALLIREIKPMDLELARRLLAMEAKRKAISDAKQAATGLIVYAADNDVLPGAEGWENKVGPYFKNADFLRDFNYTFKGGSMSSIQDPASTELGFIVGPGGRAVAYCDGHVQWIANP